MDLIYILVEVVFAKFVVRISLKFISETDKRSQSGYENFTIFRTCWLLVERENARRIVNSFERRSS